jgi:preprotein translocase subunit YajC
MKDCNVFISQAFAQAAPAAAPAADPLQSVLQFLPLVGMFVVLYFIMIRPQMKLGDSYVHVEIANGTEIQLQRSAIVQVLPKGTFGK